MNGSKFESRVKQALAEKPEPSADFEATLFSRAETLLAPRRVHLASRETTRARRITALRGMTSRLLETLAVYPDAPAFAATLATLVLAFLALRLSSGHGSGLRYSDLPAFPKSNDVPARYDAQQFAERQAYEREVEDAHQKTSGGL